MKQYIVKIYNAQNVIEDEIEVLADSQEEAEKIGFKEWLEGIRERYYNVCEED